MQRESEAVLLGKGEGETETQPPTDCGEKSDILSPKVSSIDQTQQDDPLIDADEKRQAEGQKSTSESPNRVSESPDDHEVEIDVPIECSPTGKKKKKKNRKKKAADSLSPVGEQETSTAATGVEDKCLEPSKEIVVHSPAAHSSPCAVKVEETGNIICGYEEQTPVSVGDEKGEKECETDSSPKVPSLPSSLMEEEHDDSKVCSTSTSTVAMTKKKKKKKKSKTETDDCIPPMGAKQEGSNVGPEIDQEDPQKVGLDPGVVQKECDGNQKTINTEKEKSVFCSGEEDACGSSVKKKKRKKKKERKVASGKLDSNAKDHSSSGLVNDGTTGTGGDLAIDSNDQSDKELSESHTVPNGSKETEEIGGDISLQISEEDRLCTLEETPEIFQEEKETTQDITESHDGLTGSEKVEKETESDHEFEDVQEEEIHTDAEDNSCSSTDSSQEERNILCIFKLIYGVGLRALRKLFLKINPSWSNQPCDAAGLDKGKLTLSDKKEECSFKKGNIEEWDLSLMTSVLLFSKRCGLEISKRPGHAPALRALKVSRNKLLGHPSTDRMSDAVFNTFWPQLSANFVTLGATLDDIEEIKRQSDEVLLSGYYYRKLFLAEQAKFLRCEKMLETMDSKLDAILAKQSTSGVPRAPMSPRDLSGPKWDEWLKFRNAVGDFEANQNQYILLSDALSPEDLECFSLLRGVSWKMILDFDPMSEEKGFYREFTSKEGQNNLVNMFTPAELTQSTMASLLRQLDPNKIQWLFVNGRFSDTDGSSQSFPDWEATSVKHISRLFACCSDPDKFDQQKPVVCLVLPFCDKNVPYLDVTLSRLVENFEGFKLKFVSFKHKHSHHIPRKFMVRHFDLSPQVVNLGLKEMFSTSTTQEYRMPTSQAGVSAKLSQKEYLFLKEHLEILYDGCEDLPEVSNDPAEAEKQMTDFFEEHRKSFMSGNPISFVSLYDNHDAKREIEIPIRTHIQRVLDQGLTRSLIVEIRHSPGTGGTTIARRAMWDLCKAYPCAFITVRGRHDFDEDNIIARNLVDRILALQETCHTTPVILIDGKQSGTVEGLSNKVVRLLVNSGKRALLLRCLHGSKQTSKTVQESTHVHHVFYVNVKLEHSMADLREFQSKYKERLEQSLGQEPRSDLCRVFHFPLLAMMEEFRPKLRKIIEDTLSEMGGLQQEIAVAVAFLQKYANYATPALLLHEAFKGYIRVADGKCASYEDICRQLFTEHLLNLMVPTDPLRRRGRINSARETPPERYTLQHPVVADLVLKKVFQEQDRDLFGVVRRFLQFPIYQHECFLNLFQELFAYNKNGQKLKFSILFEELKGINSEHAAKVFCEAAEKTNDPLIFTNAARFHAKKDPPAFSKAKQLIHRAFEVNQSKVRSRTLCQIKGVVLSIELKHMVYSGKVKDLKTLEALANSVLEAYHEARTFPPTYPNPLIGEVEVWLTCIEWIVKNVCKRDSDETLKFLTNLSPPFFRTCLGDSFNLLDVVDRIVQSVPDLADPEDTQRRCNNARLSLMAIFKRRHSVTGHKRAAEDLVQACKALCTARNFPKSSQLELKRLQTQFILSSSDQIENLDQENLRYLLKLLEELVLIENDHRLAYHLMKVCVLVTGPRCYSLEQGVTVSEKWLEGSQHNCLPYFYQMAIYFLKILDGNVLEFMPNYKKALKLCREKSQNHLRSFQSTLFVNKEGQGMSRLITRNTLFHGETDYSTDDSDKVTKFWLSDSRKKLLECKGRIRMGQSSGRGKSHPYIELVQGNVELYVGKNAGIGKVERDFSPGTLTHFVVSFTLQGPVANGISFSPQHPSKC